MLDDEALEENDRSSLAADCQQVCTVPASSEYTDSYLWQLVCVCVSANVYAYSCIQICHLCVCVHSNWLESVCLSPTLHSGACFISTFTELQDAKQCRINKKTQLVKCHLADKVRAGEKHDDARGRMTERWQCERALACQPTKSGEEQGKRRIKNKGHKLVFKTWAALPWQQAGTGYPQKSFGRP